MGTSVGTISALAPIAIGISEKTGFGMALCLGAVVSGAMFGDNLSMISDTTIEMCIRDSISSVCDYFFHKISLAIWQKCTF